MIYSGSRSRSYAHKFMQIGGLHVMLMYALVARDIGRCDSAMHRQEKNGGQASSCGRRFRTLPQSRFMGAATRYVFGTAWSLVIGNL